MMACLKGLSSLHRICIPRQCGQRYISTAVAPLCIQLTQVVGAEPLKKKKKLDPQLVRQKEERRKRKIEKAIRRLEKNAGQLKPVDELEVPPAILQEMNIRKRAEISITEETEESQASILKEWSNYKYQQHLAEVTLIERIIASRERALQELRQESEDLWLEAIQIDQMLLPFRVKGPVATPPIKDYNVPDGDYIDKTTKWD
ncbi:39S ribosomal protein L40, mitochondrial-like [Homarus americanus]|uniref:Large ribosomal subunit protein mL40 n=1 Tax=Homarus americanus TaxID=6706 RepID=A0A8J5T816_HOMAM|nr:39S ribosomal protein L40, mitochondrial-like [Homarus americanus]KAG7173864.1 39S ribosomal protein L40-like [Homarus americanus]